MPHKSCYCRYKQHKGLCGLSVFKPCPACVHSDHGRQYRWLRCDQQSASGDTVQHKRHIFTQFQSKPFSFSFQPASQMSCCLGEGTSPHPALLLYSLHPHTSGAGVILQADSDPGRDGVGPLCSLPIWKRPRGGWVCVCV